MIIALAGLKGGVGKSTLAVAIAGEYRARGHRVLLIDLDPVGTTRVCGDSAELDALDRIPTAWLGKHTPTADDLRELGRGFDMVVVDTPPGDPTCLDLVIDVADIVLLPCPPRAADVWALGPALSRIRSAQIRRPDLLTAVVFNAVPSRSSDVTDIRDGLREQGITVAAATVGARVAQVRAIEAGTGVTLVDPGSMAAAEIRALVREIGQWCPAEEDEVAVLH